MTFYESDHIIHPDDAICNTGDCGMNMPTTFANLLQGVHHTRKSTLLEKRNALLLRQIRKLRSEVQGAVDITTNTDSTAVRAYVGTPSKFNTYSKQVTQLGKLYDNIADWGCMIAKNVIDMRTAFSVGTGVRVIKHKDFEGDAEKELTWCKKFMRFNNLDEEMPQEYAKEAEIEGKILLRLLVDEVAKNIRIVHVPWRQFNYEVTTPAFDFFNYTRAKYDGHGDDTSFDLAPEFFVYKRFGGSASKVNTTPPKTAFVLREMEDLDKAVVDWRKINRIFAAPTPVFYAPDKQTAQELNQWLDDNNWRIGKILVLGGLDIRYELVGWTGDGYTTLKEETQALVKTISGTTGIPVHFLGYPELLSNRDTAENLIELIVLSTNKERNTWMGAYEELFQKAIVISNTIFGTSLNPSAVDAIIDELELTTAEGAGNATVPKRTAGTSGQSDSA